jgi:predicted NBD/HSP70 family sugar kinase
MLAPLVESRSSAAAVGAGVVLQLIRDHSGQSRGDLPRRPGLARSTISHRIDALIAHGLVGEVRGTASTGGRPPHRLVFNAGAGLVLAAELADGGARLAVADLTGTALAEATYPIDLSAGPEPVLARLHDGFERLLDERRRSPADVRAVSFAMPGPVQPDGRVAWRSPGAGAWLDVPIPGWLDAHYDVPAIVAGSASMMALAEHRRHWCDEQHLLFVAHGAEITCGVVACGRMCHGADGSAGDVGHLPLEGRDDVPCHCGSTGCLTAVAGGRALVSRLAACGVAASTCADIVRLVRHGDPIAVGVVRDAGRDVGEVLATLVGLFDPGVIVIGGEIAEAQDHLLPGMRHLINQRARPGAVRNVRTVRSQLGERAAVTGAAIAAVEHILAPEAVDRVLREHSPVLG